jgi:carbonic anhydrase/acetyltransferase-like protein (isoleucine patch superfamily)
MTPFRKARLVEADGRWFADSCTVVGDVTVAEGVSIWYGVVVRGDVAKISIGARTNLQDLACVHPQHDQDVEIGADCVIGHGAIVHNRVVGDGCLIGMGAILMPGARIGRGSIVAAGALVPIGADVPPGSLVVGSPGRVVRSVKEAETREIAEGVARYLDLARRHAAP